jgi:hypothetical protein
MNLSFQVNTNLLDSVNSKLDQIEAFLNEQPPISDIIATQEYLSNFRILWAEVIRYYGVLESHANKFRHNFIVNCPGELWAKIKNSSTMQLVCADSDNPYAETLKRFDQLNKVFIQLSPETNTMLSNYHKQNI